MVHFIQVIVNFMKYITNNNLVFMIVSCLLSLGYKEQILIYTYNSTSPAF